MEAIIKVKHATLAFLLALSLTACGGGGGGGGGAIPSGITYTGLTSEAAIDETNAVILSTGAYQGGQTGAALVGSVGVIQVGEEGSVGRPRMVKASRILEDAIYKLDLTSRSVDAFVGAVYTERDTIYGDYGGSASYTIKVNDETGAFSGSIKFNNYSDDGVTTVSGPVNISGLLNVYTEELIEFSFSFDNLTGASGSDSFTLNGDISFNNAVNPAVIAMTMLLKDNSTAKVYKLEDYAMTLTEESGYVDIEGSGVYFDPDYGYVTISAETPFRIYYGDAYPSDGIFVIAGDTGIAGGSTTARLTALSSSTYQVEADTTGDGIYDWNSGVLYWDDL